ncbi:hypothetical protein C4K12_4124 [Pseudomonas chlororaphis subsp. aureofaciens]|nr:hypothetical protein C4K12_4124 [Pseudomonas chlororaphis subsp. aureofaciens]
MNPFAGKPRSYRHTSLVGARLARDTLVQPTTLLCFRDCRKALRAFTQPAAAATGICARHKKSRANLAPVRTAGRRSIARDTLVQPTLHAHAPCCVFEIAGRPCGPFRSLRQRLQGFAPGIKNRGQAMSS